VESNSSGNTVERSVIEVTMYKLTKQISSEGVPAVGALVRVYYEGTSQLAKIFFDEEGLRAIPKSEILVSSTGVIEFFALDRPYTLEIVYNEKVAHEAVRPTNVLIQEIESEEVDSIEITNETVIALDTAGTSHLFCHVKLEDAPTSFVNPTAYPVGKRLTLILEAADVSNGATVSFNEKFCTFNLTPGTGSTRQVIEFVCDGLCFVPLNLPTVTPFVFQE